jgi:hypothetical protein
VDNYLEQPQKLATETVLDIEAGSCRAQPKLMNMALADDDDDMMMMLMMT